MPRKGSVRTTATKGKETINPQRQASKWAGAAGPFAFGRVSAFELYTIDALATQVFHRGRRWVMSTFIEPQDTITGRPIIDERTGEPMLGVQHFHAGHIILVSGRDLIDWAMEHSSQASAREGGRVYQR